MEKEKENAAPAAALREMDRGRHAQDPGDVPVKGWLDILARTKQQIDEDNLSIIAAGVAFYGFVAVAPALAATLGIYALVADPAQISGHLTALAQVVPGSVMPLIEEQVTRITSNEQAAGLSAILGLLIALYSSANATKALIVGLNVAYDETEKRSFVKLYASALALTAVGILGALFTIGVLAVLPTVLAHLPVGSGTETLLSWLRWPVLVGGFMLALTVLYRFAPSREEPRWKWVSGGAGLATGLWVIASGLFSFYVSHFGNYDQTYGSLGAVVVFLLWLFLTAYVVLLGAELNSEMERQTVEDTTSGSPKPLGARQARAADTIGPARTAVKSGKSTQPSPTRDA